MLDSAADMPARHTRPNFRVTAPILTDFEGLFRALLRPAPHYTATSLIATYQARLIYQVAELQL